MRALRTDGAGFSLDTDHGVVRAARLVLSAGVWTPGLAAGLGVELPIELFAPQMTVTAPLPRVLGTVLLGASRKLSMKQARSGAVLIGGGRRGWGDLATRARGLAEESMRLSAKDAVAALPVLARAEALRSWVGLEGLTPDEMPIIDHAHRRSRHGSPRGSVVMASPIGPVVGRLLGEALLDGRPSLDLSAFARGRFTGRAGAAPPRAVARPVSETSSEPDRMTPATSSFDCVVVGAGHAGLAAAAAAARAGVGVLLIDAGDGQAGPPREVTLPAGVVMRRETTAWGIFGADTVALATTESAERVHARTLVLATGAHDRPVPFPGWTLPGVVTASAARALLHDEAASTRRVLLAGSGPELSALARAFLARGAHVGALCEASPMRGLWRHGARDAPASRRRSAGLSRLAVAEPGAGADDGGPCHPARPRRQPGATGRSSRAATRTGVRLRTATGGSTWTRSWLPTAVSRPPSSPAWRAASTASSPRADAWLPVRTRELESTVPGVFVIGGAAGTTDAAAALEEGRLAGLAVASRLGSGAGRSAARERARSRGRLLHHDGLRRAMERVYPFGAGLHALADADTVLCPCEEVRVGAALRAVRDGAVNVNEVKAETRVGMGRCQGRLCGPALAHLIARETRRPVEEAGTWNPRPPARPVRLGALALEE